MSTYPYTTNTKTVYFPNDTSGQTGSYARVLQLSTGYLLDNADGIFKASPGDHEIPLVEGQPFIYHFSESRHVWDDGEYQAYAYDNTDKLFSVAQFSIYDDREVIMSNIEYEIRHISSTIEDFPIPVYTIP